MQRTHGGFTLIELLVVIAIISILASILFPTFSSAREKARQVVCISNQRQLAIVVEIWTQDNNEKMPSAETFWQDIASSDMRKILICPTVGDDPPNSYLYNNALSNLALGRIKYPLRTMLTIDGRHIATSSPRTYDNVLYTAQDIDKRHNDHAVCSFVDGHVSRDSAITGFAYVPDFTQPVGSEWSDTQTAATPVGGRQFLGEFGNQTVKLTLVGLPKHGTITVSFDLYVIRAWQGNAWELRVVDGDTLLHTTFSNLAANQAYPDEAPGGDNPARTGAAESNTLGYEHPPDGVMDTVYQLSTTFDHTTSGLELEFAASGLPAITEASWGLAKVEVNGE
jgi:prepilin-type N-terminal cleavage/methylation domain-containing protein/prepilin-type processing-associated H-X9-DG protein